MVGLWYHVGWAPNAEPTTIQHVSVDHRRSHVRMPQKLLHRANVVTGLEQLRRECVPEGVACHALRQSRSLHCVMDRVLKHGLMQMVTPSPANRIGV